MIIPFPPTVPVTGRSIPTSTATSPPGTLVFIFIPISEKVFTIEEQYKNKYWATRCPRIEEFVNKLNHNYHIKRHCIPDALIVNSNRGE